MDIGPFKNNASFTNLTRGFWFVAPVDFVITGLRVPTDVGTGNQHIAVVRLNATPPTYTTTTNSFTRLFYIANQAGTAFVSVNLSIRKGQIIGILGARTGNNGTLNNSYAQGTTYTSRIKGQGTVLRRLLMQHGLHTMAPRDLATSGGSYSRIEVRYR
jgi:hypothetical protein